MKKSLLIIVFLMGIFSVVFSQIQYSKVRVMTGENGIETMAKLGIDVQEGILKKGVFLITDLSTIELEKISNAGLSYDVIINDVSKFYAERNLNMSQDTKDYKSPLDNEWVVPDGFTFGSMGGFLTWEEVIEKLDDMYANFPNLITEKVSIGQTLEEREMWMVQISDNPGVEEGEPEVLYTAVHHAREPESMMQLIFFMYYLLENYDSDPLVQNIVDNTNLYFIPIVNPDGYVYNHTTDPNGGGMWRKNRRNSGGGAWGVDPNRNYGFKWGYDNSGSSGDPWDETYRGTAAFSEPLTQNMREFAIAHNFVSALHYHTYSNLLLYPWGWTPDANPDADAFATWSVLLTAENHYTWGPGSTTIYPVNGDSNDWFYGEQIEKDKIFAFTPEVGSSSDGFWPSQSRIIPLAQENMLQNILFALFAGNYASVTDVSPSYFGQLTEYINFDVTRIGMQDEGTYTVSLEPITDNIVSVGEAKTFSNLDFNETVNDSISFTLSPTLTDAVFKFKLTLDNGSYTSIDTITKVFGQANIVIEDDCSDLTNWTGGWNTTNESYHSETMSITDSPNSNYNSGETNTITMTNYVDLSGTNTLSATLNFWAKWHIEAGWDYTQVEIKTNGGSWTTLAGNYTKLGNENQDPGQPLYDGLQSAWVHESIDLASYIGEEIKIRFKIVSDGYVEEDGFYFDDLQIIVIDDLVGVSEDILMEESVQVFPNPSTSTLHFILPEKELNIKIFDVLGNLVFEKEKLSDISMEMNIEDWNQGMYFYQISNESTIISTGKVFKN